MTIYEPSPGLLDLRELVGGPLKTAGFLAAIDFVAENNKPWAFYAGTFSGGVAVATGIPGAAAALYVVGDLLDYHVFKSEKGSNVRIFLNGIAYATIDTYAAAATWERLQVALDDKVNKVEFVHDGPSPNNTDPGSSGWLGLAEFEVTGSDEKILERATTLVSTWKLTYSIVDDKDQIGQFSFYLPFDERRILIHDRFQVVEFAQAVAEALSEIITGYIRNVSITLSFQPKDVRDFAFPVADVEEGMRISYRTQGNFSYAHTIPTIDEAILESDGQVDYYLDEVIDFMNLMTNPEALGAGWEVHPCDARTDYLVRVIDAQATFKER